MPPLHRPLHLVTDEREQRIEQIRAVATRGETDVQLLCSIILDLTKDLAMLKAQVKELQHCQPV
jgi:uncharacterized protein YydD (DUF2326 family)